MPERKKIQIGLLVLLVLVSAGLLFRYKFSASILGSNQIMGILIDETSAAPIVGARVTLVPDPPISGYQDYVGTATTDANGRYIINTTARNGNMTMVKDGYYDLEGYIITDSYHPTLQTQYINLAMKPGFGKEAFISKRLYKKSATKSGFTALSLPFIPYNKFPDQVFTNLNIQGYGAEGTDQVSIFNYDPNKACTSNTGYNNPNIKLYYQGNQGTLVNLTDLSSPFEELKAATGFYLQNDGCMDYQLTVKGQAIYQDYIKDLNGTNISTAIGNPYLKDVSKYELQIIDGIQNYSIDDAIVNNLIDKNLGTRTGLNSGDISNTDLTNSSATLRTSNAYILTVKKDGLKLKYAYPNPKEYIEVPEDVSLVDINQISKHDPSLPPDQQAHLDVVVSELYQQTHQKMHENKIQSDAIVLTKKGVPIVSEGVISGFSNYYSAPVSSVSKAKAAATPDVKFVFDEKDWGSANPEPYSTWVNEIKTNLINLYGPPPFSYTVLVNKKIMSSDDLVGAAATFNISLNVLGFDPDYPLAKSAQFSPYLILTHEMIHALYVDEFITNDIDFQFHESLTQASTLNYNKSYYNGVKNMDSTYKFYDKVNGVNLQNISGEPEDDETMPILSRALWVYAMGGSELYKVELEHPETLRKNYEFVQNRMNTFLNANPAKLSELKTLLQKLQSSQQAEREATIAKILAIIRDVTSVNKDECESSQCISFSDILTKVIVSNSVIEGLNWKDWELKQVALQFVTRQEYKNSSDDNNNYHVYQSNGNVFDTTVPDKELFFFYHRSIHGVLTYLGKKIESLAYNQNNNFNSETTQTTEAKPNSSLNGTISMDQKIPGRNRYVFIPDPWTNDKPPKREWLEPLTGWDMYDSNLKQIRDNVGFFGVVDVPTDGIVTVKDLGTNQTYTAQVADGIFTIPTTLNLAGRFKLNYTKDNINIEKYINKGRGDYYVFFQTDTQKPQISNVKVTSDHGVTKVSFDTDEDTSAVMQYKPENDTTNADQFNYSDGATVSKSHTLTFANLDSTKKYTYRIYAIDQAGNYFYQEKTFQPIAINNIQAKNISDASAEISWETVPNSKGTIEYGTTINYGQKAEATAIQPNQLLTLTSLTVNIVYHYRIKAYLDDGSEALSEDKTFTTTNDPLAITPGAGNLIWWWKTPTTGRSAWSTNKDSTCSVSYQPYDSIDGNGNFHYIKDPVTVNAVTTDNRNFNIKLENLMPIRAYTADIKCQEIGTQRTASLRFYPRGEFNTNHYVWSGINVASTSSSITLSWQSNGSWPDGYPGNQTYDYPSNPITDGYVEYYKLGDPIKLKVDFPGPGDPTSLMLTGLEPSVGYRIDIYGDKFPNAGRAFYTTILTKPASQAMMNSYTVPLESADGLTVAGTSKSSTSEVTLDWSKVADSSADSYNIYASDGTGEGVLAASVTKDETTYKTNVDTGKAYHYKITSVKEGKEKEITKATVQITQEKKQSLVSKTWIKTKSFFTKAKNWVIGVFNR